jgi:ABC-type multidrug transport system ATPase subunit
MIIANNISKRYGKVFALDNVSFTLEAGESIALWGANGAGKTTAIRCLLGVHSFEGTLTVDKIDVQQQGKKARSLIGYVPQEMAFFDMSVLETLQFYARLKKNNPERIATALETVQLIGHDEKSVKALSGGMKQRLALAIALLADPPILLLDEPTASLDAGAQRDFIKLIRSLNISGKTIVFSSHRFEEVAALANQVIILESGKLKTICTPAQLASELGLRQWLRVEIADDFRLNACDILRDKGYDYVPNGTSLYVNIQEGQRMAVLRTLENGAVPILDFDITDSYAVPSRENKS